MENDSIRATGTDTLVDIWIDGKIRAISVSQEAIGAFLGFEQATAMSERDRSEFVRAHLPLLVTAARAQLRESPDADDISIGLGDLPRADGKSGDRRNTQRRTDERRKSASPGRPPIERRRRDRRQSERRTITPTAE
jgi:hypothetical protein